MLNSFSLKNSLFLQCPIVRFTSLPIRTFHTRIHLYSLEASSRQNYVDGVLIQSPPVLGNEGANKRILSLRGGRLFGSHVIPIKQAEDKYSYRTRERELEKG